MEKKQDGKLKKSGMNLILGLMTLFFAVVLIFAAVGQFGAGKGVSGAVSICGVLLFGGVGAVLLCSELRRWKKKK